MNTHQVLKWLGIGLGGWLVYSTFLLGLYAWSVIYQVHANGQAYVWTTPTTMQSFIESFWQEQAKAANAVVRGRK